MKKKHSNLDAHNPSKYTSINSNEFTVHHNAT